MSLELNKKEAIKYMINNLFYQIRTSDNKLLHKFDNSDKILSIRNDTKIIDSYEFYEIENNKDIKYYINNSIASELCEDIDYLLL